jgi:hypothetical protein
MGNKMIHQDNTVFRTHISAINDRLAIDKLHDKVRQPLFGTAAVEEPRNVR